MELGQVIFFVKKSHGENEAGRPVPDIFLFSKTNLDKVNENSLQFSFNIF